MSAMPAIAAVSDEVVASEASLGGDAESVSLGRRSLAHSRLLFTAIIGPVALLVVWEILALTVFAGKHSVPTPVGVVRGMWNDRGLYGDNAPTTLREAGLGYLWGNLAALGLAGLVSLVPFLEKTLLRIAITSYCIPIVAIAPVLNIVLNGDAPKATLAALSVFFTTLVGALLGLRSADANSLDVVRAYGGGRWAALAKVRFRFALPATFAGLRIAAPAALLGAVIGEYLGGDTGLGIAMINSEQGLEINRTWGIAMFVTLVALIGYIITELVARWLTPWAPRINASSGRSFSR
jgi:ABC-type nitrate/sulfonate/bicarbonate transport system permease component